MKKLNEYIIEKLKINNSVNKNKEKFDGNFNNLDRKIIRPMLEEYGYYYMSDYDTDFNENLKVFSILYNNQPDRNTVEEITLDIINDKRFPKYKDIKIEEEKTGIFIYIYFD